MPTRRPARTIAPREKLWLTWGSEFLMGPNYLRFLRAVEERGTIREAGEVVGWSYRTCLNRIRRMEAVLGEPVLLTTRGGVSGGGARVSPRALRLADVYEQWRDQVLAYSERSFRRAVRAHGDMEGRATQASPRQASARQASARRVSRR